MCIIFVADMGERPTPEMLELGKQHNNDATGIAWREPDPDDPTKMVVHWKKGCDITLEEAQHLAATLPLPYVIHFRNASGGTSKKDGCAHPFPIEPKVPLLLEGITEDPVLFHNGFWTNWKNNLLEAAMRSRLKVPTDSWSDSRGLAWMAAHFGLGILELIDEKVVAFGPEELDVFGSRDWKRINGVLCSNDNWERRVHTGGSHNSNHSHSQLPQHYQNQGNRGHHGANPHGAGSSTTNTRSTSPGTGGSSAATPFRGAAGASGSEESANNARGLSQQEAAQEAHEGDGLQSGRGHGQEASSAWARQINSKNYRRGSVASSIVPFERAQCAGRCGKKNAFIEERGKQYCFDCWHETFGYNTSATDMSRKLYITSKCEFCQDREAQQMTEAERKWICGTCWHAARQPAVKRILKTGSDTRDRVVINDAKRIDTSVVM